MANDDWWGKARMENAEFTSAVLRNGEPVDFADTTDVRRARETPIAAL
jgi:hypothetical protein